MNHFKRFFFIVLVLLSGLVKAQDKIILLNGKTKDVFKVLGVSDEKLIFQESDNAEASVLSVNKIFSFVKKNAKKEEFVYKRDTTIDNYLTIPQMSMYVRGMQDGRKYYKSPLSTIEGVAFGVAGGFIIPIYSSLSFIPPAIGLLAVNVISPNLEKQPIPDKNLFKNNDYAQGYLKRARDKKLTNAIIGIGIGLFSTLGFLIISGSLKN
jgi:hypothetical protein